MRDKIAIIGIGCRFPGGADTPEAFWEHLRDGVDAISSVPARWRLERCRDDRAVPPFGGSLNSIDAIDGHLFRMTDREAAQLDPAQWLLLATAWQAMENAGVDAASFAKAETGVFVGVLNDGSQSAAGIGTGAGAPSNTQPSLYDLTGKAQAFASGRLAYYLNCHGPAVTIDTASSASLVAVHMACQSLWSGECDMAIAAGVNLITSPYLGMILARSGILSPDGRCRGFDDAAAGYGRGEGCGVIILKRYADARTDGNRIIAGIRGTAAGHDGLSDSLTTPSLDAQIALVTKALRRADVQPDDIAYVEAHAPGNPVGDPVEGRALETVFGNERSAPLIVGSVKSNIGHLEAAAGIAGLIKTALALEHGWIPPHLHFSKLTTQLDGWVVDVPTSGRTWPETDGDRPLLAGVTSLGLAGTSAHVILEQAPTADAPDSKPGGAPSRNLHILPLSAATEGALSVLKSRYASRVEKATGADAADLARAASQFRTHLPHRQAIVWRTPEDAAAQLHNPRMVRRSGGGTPGKTAFLFTGGASQYVNMGKGLFQSEPVFRDVIRQADEILKDHIATPLIRVLYPEPGDDPSLINRIDYQQPALLALSYGLSELWKQWGIEPDVVTGHSFGEYTAACVAGALRFEDGLRLVAERGRLMQETRPGIMVALEAPPTQVAEAVEPFGDMVAIASVNGPCSVVISGEETAVSKVLARLPGIETRHLSIDRAGHSPFMEPAMAAFEAAIKRVQFQSPQKTFVSALLGRVVDGEIRESGYWRRHLREAVLFADAVTQVRNLGVRTFVEMGPRPTLTAMARTCLEAESDDLLWMSSLHPDRDDLDMMLQSLGAFFEHGGDVKWRSVAGPAAPHLASQLPYYPFGEAPQAPSTETVRDDDLRLRLRMVPSDQQAEVIRHHVEQEIRSLLRLGVEETIDPTTKLKDIGVDSLMGVELRLAMEQAFGLSIPQAGFLRAASIDTLTEEMLDRWQNRPTAGHGYLADPEDQAPKLTVGQPSVAKGLTISVDEPDDFASVAKEIPQIHAVIDEQIGRKLRIVDHWVIDFASVNYLGMDLHPALIDSIDPSVRAWGAHPSWSRAVATPAPYVALEEEVARLVGSYSTLVFPAVTLMNAGLLPVIVGHDGVVLKDTAAHRCIHEGCNLAKSNGAEFLEFRHNDPEDLENRIKRYPHDRRKVIAIDGVYSMSGAIPPLHEFSRIARDYNAWIFMDDAHGFGIIGEDPTEDYPYGYRGNGVVRRLKLSYEEDRVIYGATLSKAYASMAAFVTCNDDTMKDLFRTASTFIFSGPSPTGSIAAARAALRINETEGDHLRRHLFELTKAMVTGSNRLGFETINHNYFPIVGVVLGKTSAVVDACKVLWEHGILVMPALFPIVPMDRGMLRFSLTSANTMEEVEQALTALASL